MYAEHEKKAKRKKEPKPQALSGRRNYYALQRGRTEDNKLKRLEKHCRNHPLDDENRKRLNKKGLTFTARAYRKIRRAEKLARLLPSYQQTVREEITRMQQHNANQQQIQGPLLSEIGIRLTLQNLRHRFSREMR